MITKTLSPENQAKIVCPIFHAETRLAGCFVLRDMYARGDGPVDKRRGCQCAMEAGKCPVEYVIKAMVRTGEDTMHATEPKVIKFDDYILDRVAPVLVRDSQINKFDPSPNEKKALLQANEDARSGVRKAIPKSRRAERVIEDVPTAPDPTPSVSDALVEAAKSGDMSAAISTGEGN